ncbi:LysR substrate-binding domain-containing protein [Bradyrhizobium cenepequi]|uniref:LysR substrate-binding domain-containing protein n=1 Tax=Bradyrhizobium cenepequi TaxID=2821403 RepID=UPI001CE266C4|nr:LysR substrate-binding domain-containing protein [Bradyrhizobium cenepequi]MCA6109291.1 LysR family transcriptional regulator [Bradyrhizobium cenepequi]
MRPLLDELDAAIESVNAHRDNPAGHLRLTIQPLLAHFVLAPLLARFLEEYPEITLEISVQSALTDIVAGRYDAGIRVGSRLARDMIAVRITGNVRYVVVASPGYVERRGSPRRSSDLYSHSCIRLRPAAGGFIPWKFISEGKAAEVEVRGPLIADDPELVVRAALDGIGIAYIDEDCVAPMIADGRLIRLFENAILPTAEGSFLYYPGRRQDSAALKALIAFLRTNLRRETEK